MEDDDDEKEGENDNEDEKEQTVSLVGSNSTCPCGYTGGSSSSIRIVGGVAVEKHMYPWQVGLVRFGNSRPFCGGTLIGERHVMTAAHCTAAMQSNPRLGKLKRKPI